MHTSYSYILFTTIFINNIILVQFFGLCPFLGVSKRKEMAVGMALATSFVLILSTGGAYILQTYLLSTFNIEYIRTIAYITLVAMLVGLTEIVVQYSSPLLHRVLGVYLPLITTNCAVLGMMLIVTRNNLNLAESVLTGAGAAIGFSLIIILFTSIREKLESANVPKPFKGTPIALITAGIMAIAFSGFSGL